MIIRVCGAALILMVTCADAHASGAAGHAAVASHAVSVGHATAVHASAGHETVTGAHDGASAHGSRHDAAAPVFVHAGTGAHAESCPEPYTSYDDCRRND
ncbi:MAG: hypothetical protein ABF876_05430 [Acetobacter aceti]